MNLHAAANYSPLLDKTVNQACAARLASGNSIAGEIDFGARRFVEIIGKNVERDIRRDFADFAVGESRVFDCLSIRVRYRAAIDN